MKNQNLLNCTSKIWYNFEEKIFCYLEYKYYKKYLKIPLVNKSNQKYSKYEKNIWILNLFATYKYKFKI